MKCSETEGIHKRSLGIEAWMLDWADHSIRCSLLGTARSRRSQEFVLDGPSASSAVSRRLGKSRRERSDLAWRRHWDQEMIDAGASRPSDE